MAKLKQNPAAMAAPHKKARACPETEHDLQEKIRVRDTQLGILHVETLEAEELQKLTLSPDKGKDLSPVKKIVIKRRGSVIERLEAFEEREKEAKTAEEMFALAKEVAAAAAVKRLDALKCYEQAAEAGFAQAQVKCGNIYRQGIWCKKDAEKCVQYYAMAVKQEYSPAYFLLGSVYLQGMDPVQPDAQMAEQLIAKGAKAGDPKAVKRMAVLEKQKKRAERLADEAGGGKKKKKAKETKDGKQGVVESQNKKAKNEKGMTTAQKEVPQAVLFLSDDCLQWTPEQVCEWLGPHRAPTGFVSDTILQAFLEDGINGRGLAGITNEALVEMGEASARARTRLLQLIATRLATNKST